MDSRLMALGAVAAIGLLTSPPGAWAYPVSPDPLAIVTHTTRVKIIESNNVSLRPGSIYDNITYFESLLELPQPGFNYEFIDTGLGAAEPLYPNYQKGVQGSWLQLFPAFFSSTARHIDHFTSLPTPDGCWVDSAYLLRGIDEFKNLYQQEKAEGYTMIVIRLEYYTATTPGAECGRHHTNPPDPNFKPMDFLKAHLKAQQFSDFPAAELARFEAKTSAIYNSTEEFSRTKWPRFNLDNLNHNSLWYYPDGFKDDYGISTPRPQPGLASLNLPRQLVITPSDALRASFPLADMLEPGAWQKLQNFWHGKPTPDFDNTLEPGHDALDLADVTPRNIYTSGLYLEPILDANADASDPSHFALVGMTLKPWEQQDDVAYDGLKTVPQFRLVYQLMDPRTPGRPFEQLFIHLKYDVVDRLADDATRESQRQAFMERADQLAAAKNAPPGSGGPSYDELLAAFIRDFAGARPIQSIAFSSSMTGIWVFGTLTRSNNLERELQPLRIVREDVDVGYYSSTFDNDIFNQEIRVATGDRKTALQTHMDDITPSVYRDPKRMNAAAINFNRMTCAQCHQTSGRDGIHMSFNDHIDSRFTAPVRASEYLYHDADLQLQESADPH